MGGEKIGHSNTSEGLLGPKQCLAKLSQLNDSKFLHAKGFPDAFQNNMGIGA